MKRDLTDLDNKICILFINSFFLFLFTQFNTNQFIIIILMQQPQKKLNQRATHFSLGSVGQPGGSIYTVDYVKKQGEQDPNYKYTDPFKGNSINPPNKSTFSTTNNAMYKNWDGAQKAGLDKDKLNDLRTHHFNLGSYNPNQATTTHQHYYDKKQITPDALMNREQAKQRMRAHYHDFKQQPYTNFKSTYKNQYSAKESDVNGYVKPESSQNAIVFGNHHLPMMTTNNADYTKKQVVNNSIKSTLQQSSNLVLGDKSQSMQTMNQLYYGQKPLTKNQLPQATMKELRNTHFNLGGMPINYHTQMGSSYNKLPAEALNNYKNVPSYDSGTWVPKDAKFDGRTTNNRDLPARKVEPFSKAEPKTKSQFSLGNQGNNYTTEFSQNFNPKQPNYTGKATKPKDNSEPFSEKGTYDTEHRSSFKNRNLNDARLKVDIAALNKTDHFQIGGTGIEDKITVYQDQYRRDQDHKSKLFHKDNL